MQHIHYDINTGRITGFYCEGVSQVIPSPTLKVSEEIKEEVERRPHRFRIVDRRLEEVKTQDTDIKSVRKDVGEFKYNGAVYVADRMFLTNLSINLSICASKKDHTCKFWCVVDGQFVKRDHNSRELLNLAEIYESVRSEQMGE